MCRRSGHRSSLRAWADWSISRPDGLSPDLAYSGSARTRGRAKRWRMIVLDALRFHFPRGVAALEARLDILRKAISFGLVGVVNATIDFAVFWTAVHAFALPKVPANVVSWMVAVSASYVMNSFTTFAAESGRKLRWRAYGAFVVSGVAGMLASTI